MSENFDQLLEESFKTISVGDVVTGEVIGVKEDEISLNIGGKADGIVSRREYTNDANADLRELVKVGDKLEVKVLKINDGEGMYQLSFKRLQSERSSKVLEAAFESGEVLKGKVTQVVKGGMTVEIDGAKVFVPASLASDSFEKDLNKYMDQEIEFVLTEYNPKKHRIIGDRKQIVVKQKEAQKKELFEKIAVGMKVNGVVKNIADFGVFVDIGGVDGLLHNTELSWKRIVNPKDMFKTGDTVEVMIKAMDGEKIALTRKFPEANPWTDAAVKYEPGIVVTGVVARMADFGAFVELEEGVDALLHVSQISKTRIGKPSDVLQIGQTIEAAVLTLDVENKKISISMKALLPDDEPDEVEENGEAVVEEAPAEE